MILTFRALSHLFPRGLRQRTEAGSLPRSEDLCPLNDLRRESPNGNSDCEYLFFPGVLLLALMIKPRL